MVSLRDFFVMAGEILRRAGRRGGRRASCARRPCADPDPPAVGSIAYRTADAHDSRAVCDVFLRALRSSSRASGGAWPARRRPDEFWRQRRALFEHLARCADRWLGRRARRRGRRLRTLAGRGSVRQRELFVLPEAQRAGVGARCWSARSRAGDGAQRRAASSRPLTRARRRATCARACGRSARVYGLTLGRSCRWRSRATSAVAPLPRRRRACSRPTARGRQRAVLGYVRGVDHGYLALQRTPLLALRGGEAAGYGYVGERCGPFAALDPADLPALLAAAESEAARPRPRLRRRGARHVPRRLRSPRGARLHGRCVLRASCWPTRRCRASTATSDGPAVLPVTAGLVCAAPFAPLRDRPDEASEQHTQVLFGDRLAVHREAGDWLEVTAPDGYRGYVQPPAPRPGTAARRRT